MDTTHLSSGRSQVNAILNFHLLNVRAEKEFVWRDELRA
jgi:hypothetical protein